MSDGNQTIGDAAAEIPALVENNVRVFSATPPMSATQRVALTGFDAPGAVRANQRFTFHLAIESEAPNPVKINLELTNDKDPVGGQTVELKPGLNRFELPYRIDQPGAYIMGARLLIPASMTALNSTAETAMTVMAPPQILVAGSAPPESLLNALKLREYNVTVTSPRSLPTHPEDYLPYQGVILSDATVATLSNASAAALNRYVSEFGGGLIATGETLRDERFAGTPLEKTLPVKFQPQPPPPSREPIAVFLCIDRSNSMSYDSRYPAVRDGERIRYAKTAAIALLRQLDDTDLAGVIAFDSQPYVLGHLAPLGEDRGELENRIERLEPGGGTDFKDALEIAEKEILDSKIAVRQIFLLTDGDTNRQYHDHDALIADFAAQKIPVSTLRIGPDLANLQLLQDFAQATGGTFYRVQDIEKLPLLLVGLTREAMNRRKQGRSELEAGGPSAILTGIDVKDMPPIDYYATTLPKDGAQVPLKITRHDGSCAAARRVAIRTRPRRRLQRGSRFAGDAQLDSMGPLCRVLVTAGQLGDASGRRGSVFDAGRNRIGWRRARRCRESRQQPGLQPGAAGDRYRPCDGRSDDAAVRPVALSRRARPVAARKIHRDAHGQGRRHRARHHAARFCFDRHRLRRRRRSAHPPA